MGKLQGVTLMAAFIAGGMWGSGGLIRKGICVCDFVSHSTETQTSAQPDVGSDGAFPARLRNVSDCCLCSGLEPWQRWEEPVGRRKSCCCGRGWLMPCFQELGADI